MTDRPHRPTRRAVLAGAGLGLLASAPLGIGPASAAKKKTRSAKPAEPEVDGTLLPIPRLVDLVDGETFDLVAEAATHAFLKDKPVAVVGYGGGYMGPALRLKRGTKPKVRLTNRLARPTNVHWHGLLVAGRSDGGTHPGVAPGATWETELAVDQPAATLWYHAHVHGRTAQDVHDGLCGLMLIEDETSAGLGLPSAWGVDDIPLVLQDRTFDAAGRPVRAPTPTTVEHGLLGATMIVNGVADAVARVPARLVRLRLLNATGARNFRLFFEDQRSFRLIATDAGLVAEPIELTRLVLAPGERAEILVDFAEGAATLFTAPDPHEHRAGAQTTLLPDVVDAPVKVVAFEPVKDERPSAVVPATLAELPAPPRSTSGLKRRRFELRVRPNPAMVAQVGAHDHHAMSHGSTTNGQIALDGGMTASSEPPVLLTINGKPFAMGRIDEKVPLGATEVWEIVSPDMSHPFHVHGAHFRVLSEDGDKPKSWNRGLKDTVLVENSAEILVTFTRPAGSDAPFLYHCHLLEHEDGGMMGAFTVE